MPVASTCVSVVSTCVLFVPGAEKGGKDGKDDKKDKKEKDKDKDKEKNSEYSLAFFVQVVLSFTCMLRYYGNKK